MMVHSSFERKRREQVKAVLCSCHLKFVIMIMTEKQQNDDWYTEEDVDSKLSWNKLEEEYANVRPIPVSFVSPETPFSQVGYREGITAGKEQALQGGFDDGFATIGAPLGREVGILRGIVHVLLARWETQANDDTPSTQSVPYSELRALSRRLDAIRFKDLAPKDVQAELHALEHMDVEKEGQDDVLAQSFSALGTMDRPDARKELNEIRLQLQSILCNMTISIDLS